MGIPADVMTTDLKSVSCIVCGGSSRRIRSRNEKPLFRCSHCALFFFSIEQLPENLYDSAYSGKVADSSFEEFHFRAQYLAPLSRTEFLLPPPQQLSLRWLTAHAAPGSTVLDVGCGWGAMLRALRARNFRAIGLDLSRRVADTLERQGFEIHVRPGRLLPFVAA